MPQESNILIDFACKFIDEDRKFHRRLHTSKLIGNIALYKYKTHSKWIKKEG